MSLIRLILEYENLFDDEPKGIDFYLNGITKEVLIQNALYYCSLSTKIEPELNYLFYPFLLESDKETKYEKSLKNKVLKFLSKEKVIPVIINVRTSLKFFELVQGYDSEENIDLSESAIRQRLLKVYLLLNKRYNGNFPNKENLNEMIVAQSLTHSIYSDINYLHLRVTELIKACLFMEYCKENIPSHFKIFLQEYGITKWQEYITYLHQIGMLIVERNINEPVKSITIPIDDKNYAKKVIFFDKFCLQNIYHNDQDYTKIKSNPVIKNEKTGEYYIIFEQFFIEKMFKGLYFTFKNINNLLKGSNEFITSSKFKSDIGLKFSEKVLMNKTLKDSLGNKYKHLGYEELQKQGCPDYYMRDGKNIFLFECKDNLIKKEVAESGNIDDFIEECKHIFLNNKEGKPKAIKQLIKNITEIRKGNLTEDKGINVRDNVIYPIIIVHNSIFSLTGINALLNEWFFTEIESQKIDKRNIKNLTVININSLILFQGLISQKNYGIRKLIDTYWGEYEKFTSKKYPTPEIVVSELFNVSKSFDKHVEIMLSDKNIFTKELKRYNDYFLEEDD